MPGPKLRSASVHQYAALGERGLLLYALAPQILATIRSAFPDFVHYFAVPQLSDDGSHIDWYAQTPGVVVPWSATRPLEQEKARARLVGVRDQILSLQPSMGSERDDDARVCFDMLTWVFHHPDDSHRFLVNGHPVLTFWGFTGKGADPGRDPLDFSIIYYPDQAEQGMDHVERIVRSRAYSTMPVMQQDMPWWRRGWLWLSLSLSLVLLALALFFALPVWPELAQNLDDSAHPAPPTGHVSLCKHWGWCATRSWPGSDSAMPEAGGEIPLRTGR